MTFVTNRRRLLAEFVGTALLVTAVVGSGLMATTLSPDDVGLQLLENSTATAFTLGALILTFDRCPARISTRSSPPRTGSSAGAAAPA
jgi:glycerol uptake facilitator-like aquaporin